MCLRHKGRPKHCFGLLVMALMNHMKWTELEYTQSKKSFLHNYVCTYTCLDTVCTWQKKKKKHFSCSHNILTFCIALFYVFWGYGFVYSLLYFLSSFLYFSCLGYLLFRFKFLSLALLIVSNFVDYVLLPLTVSILFIACVYEYDCYLLMWEINCCTICMFNLVWLYKKNE